MAVPICWLSDLLLASLTDAGSLFAVPAEHFSDDCCHDRLNELYAIRMKLTEYRSLPAHLASRSANGLAATASSSLISLPTMAAMRSRAVASMSRNSPTCA